MATTTTRQLLLLGAGYTGAALITAAPRAGFAPLPTSRTPAGKPPLDGTQWIGFDLEGDATWTNLPTASHIVWLFPAVPPGQVSRFARHCDLQSRRLVVLGTTSSYLHEQDGAEVNELNPLDLTVDRVKGEEYLRSLGATVLRAAGIYGPALGSHPMRNPLSWLRRGMIASPDQWINLIHVSDLAGAILGALGEDLRGEQLIVSDGTPRRWGDIGEWALRNGLLEEVRYSGSGGKPSKRVSNARLTARLGPVVAHADLFAELVALEGRQPRKETSPAP